jgi:hypothetical protein
MGLFVSNVIALMRMCTHGYQKKFHHALLISLIRSNVDPLMVIDQRTDIVMVE